MMFVILAYDICEARVNKVAKIAKKYLIPIQRSLYQGFLSEKQLFRLKNELALCIEPEYDSVLIYKAQNTNDMIIDAIGANGSTDCIY